ncbi:hypothetical protein DITRI_Ditri19aG0082900 [Diplodiscus trichospermus]
MKVNGETIFDVQVLEKMLRTLIKRFDVVATIEESKDLNTRTIDGLQGSLETHEQRLDTTSTKMVEIPSLVKDKQEKRYCHARRSDNRDNHTKVAKNGADNTETLLMASLTV